MTKLLFVIKGSAINRAMNTGIENLAWGLAERGFEVHILSGGTMPARHKYRFPNNVTYHFTNNSGSPGDHLDPYVALQAQLRFHIVIGWIKNLAPLSAFHGQSEAKPRFIANEGQTTSWLSQFFAIRCLSSLKRSLRGVRFSSKRFLFGCWSAKTSGLWMDRVVAISTAVSNCAANIYGVEKKLIHIIPRGIDVGLFNPANVDRHLLRNERPRLIFTGNIAKKKGLGDVADALSLLSEPVDWVICGKDQGYLRVIEGRLNERPRGHRLIYRGPLTQEKLVSELQCADVFVFPSWDERFGGAWGEGLGKSLLEAMSCGLPVIVSSIEAFAGVVDDGVNGTVVSVRSPHSIARAISSYVQDGDLRVSHGHNARQTIGHKFTKEMELNSWSSIIEGELQSS